MANTLILKDLISYLGYSVSRFEREINVGSSSIAKAMERKSDMKDDTIKKIILTFPQVSEEWLRTGNPPMIKNQLNTNNGIDGVNNSRIIDLQSSDIQLNRFNAESISTEQLGTERTKGGNEFIDIGHGRYIMLVPFVDEYAYGGYLVGFKDSEYIDNLPKHSMIVSEKHLGTYRTFTMRGDSMYNGENDSIEEGDKVTGRMIAQKLWKSRLHINKFKEFIIVCENGIIVKEITIHDLDTHTITIHSKNPDKDLYPDETIDLADVRELYNVIEVTKPRK